MEINLSGEVSDHDARSDQDAFVKPEMGILSGLEFIQADRVEL